MSEPVPHLIKAAFTCRIVFVSHRGVFNAAFSCILLILVSGGLGLLLAFRFFGVVPVPR